jgi:hypothetical protein
MFRAILTLKHLRAVEIAGGSRWRYRPKLLAQLESLEELRVIMPDIEFCDALASNLETWAEREQGGLRALSIISRACPQTSELVADG